MIQKHVKKYIFIEIFVLIFGFAVITGKNTAEKSSVAIYKTIVQETVLSNSIQRGSEVYQDFCIQCHRADGTGSKQTYPPLAGSDWLVNKREKSIHSVKYGLSGSIKVNGIIYNNSMASMGLYDKEVADVMNYIMNSWGNTQKRMVTEKEVANIKK